MVGVGEDEAWCFGLGGRGGEGEKVMLKLGIMLGWLSYVLKGWNAKEVRNIYMDIIDWFYVTMSVPN